MTKKQIAKVAEVLGFFVLLPACILGGWTGAVAPSSKPYPAGTPGQGIYRPMVDQWRWTWLNPWYSNVEDGVSGQQAWVWSKDTPPVLVPYGSTYPAWFLKNFPTKIKQRVVAYGWSTWRNGAHAAKIAAGDISANTD